MKMSSFILGEYCSRVPTAPIRLEPVGTMESPTRLCCEADCSGEEEGEKVRI